MLDALIVVDHRGFGTVDFQTKDLAIFGSISSPESQASAASDAKGRWAGSPASSGRA